MKLKQIINNLNCAVIGDDSVIVKNLTHNSKTVKKGDMFFCLSGGNKDGHNFVDDAIANGAVVIVSEKKVDTPSSVTNVICGNSRKFMSECAINFFNRPSENMIIVSITGTNGKTTSSFMIASIFENAGKRVGIIGTNGIYINGEKTESNMTTPDPIELQKTLYKMKEKGVEVVVMEMSAHALFYEKNWGLMSDIAVFTNLTQDHLDFFSNMENYGCAKKKLFSKNYARFAVINIDDEFSKTIIDKINIPYITVSKCGYADICAYDILPNVALQEFKVKTGKNSLSIKINLGGKFNISNALGAIGVAKLCCIDDKAIQRGLETLKIVPGRFNVHVVNGIKFIIDYAHTPDGLKNILLASREILEDDGKLISVFGCGGNRDSLKRPIMGRLSSQLADVTIVTSDNPRFEKPMDIINQIVSGIENKNYIIEPSREVAIKTAFEMATNKDIIVVSGKGSENYMDVCGEKLSYSDADTIKNLWR